MLPHPAEAGEMEANMENGLRLYCDLLANKLSELEKPSWRRLWRDLKALLFGWKG